VPDLHDLDHFDQGLPAMDLLPASEIRRRGDRMRRRRTAGVAAAGVLAAAVAIGTPVVALSGSGADRDVAPPIASSSAATEPAEPSGGWLTEIPDDFPLTSGFADPDATPNDGLAQDPSLSVACRSKGFAGFVDNAVVTYQGESEDRAVRILVLYPDAAAATAELAVLRSDIDGCAPVDVAKGTTMVSAAVPVDLGTEESFAFSQQIQHDDGLVSDLSLFEVARTGNAIYVDMSYGAAGGAQVVTFERDRLKERSAAPLQEMCRFAEHPCTVEGEPAS
jgi:hypothetical protein